MKKSSIAYDLKQKDISSNLKVFFDTIVKAYNTEDEKNKEDLCFILLGFKKYHLNFYAEDVLDNFIVDSLVKNNIFNNKEDSLKFVSEAFKLSANFSTEILEDYIEKLLNKKDKKTILKETEKLNKNLAKVYEEHSNYFLKHLVSVKNKALAHEFSGNIAALYLSDRNFKNVSSFIDTWNKYSLLEEDRIKLNEKGKSFLYKMSGSSVPDGLLVTNDNKGKINFIICESTVVNDLGSSYSGESESLANERHHLTVALLAKTMNDNFNKNKSFLFAKSKVSKEEAKEMENSLGLINKLKWIKDDPQAYLKYYLSDSKNIKKDIFNMHSFFSLYPFPGETKEEIYLKKENKDFPIKRNKKMSFNNVSIMLSSNQKEYIEKENFDHNGIATRLILKKMYKDPKKISFYLLSNSLGEYKFENIFIKSHISNIKEDFLINEIKERTNLLLKIVEEKLNNEIDAITSNKKEELDLFNLSAEVALDNKELLSTGRVSLEKKEKCYIREFFKNNNNTYDNAIKLNVINNDGFFDKKAQEKLEFIYSNSNINYFLNTSVAGVSAEKNRIEYTKNCTTEEGRLVTKVFSGELSKVLQENKDIRYSFEYAVSRANDIMKNIITKTSFKKTNSKKEYPLIDIDRISNPVENGLLGSIFNDYIFEKGRNKLKNYENGYGECGKKDVYKNYIDTIRKAFNFDLSISCDLLLNSSENFSKSDIKEIIEEKYKNMLESVGITENDVSLKEYLTEEEKYLKELKERQDFLNLSNVFDLYDIKKEKKAIKKVAILGR